MKMIERLLYYAGDGFDPYRNLASEQFLMETVPGGCCTMYLWQNKNTVVIGRNQNAWSECRTAELERDGGRLVRRLSGGGAVFHDLGNLNFTFVAGAADYNTEKQSDVVLAACRRLGIPAEKSGRNDFLAGGRKFSGNAFYTAGGRSCHHGTLLVDVDMDNLSRYLNPSKEKLESKGVASVGARVINLKELCPGLTVPVMRSAMEEAFAEVYRLTPEKIPDISHASRVEELYGRNRSWEWNYGRRLPLSFLCSGRFAWGGAELRLEIDGGVIKDADIYTDAMDWSFAGPLCAALTGCRFSLDEMTRRVREVGCSESIREDICRMLSEQEI